MTLLSAEAQAFLERPAIRRLVVAYSGGIDSTVLLHAVAGLGKPVLALHIDHQINPESDDWQAHCRQVAASLSVPFRAIRVDVARNGSIELAARNARYAAFLTVLKKGDCLLTAHHADDEIETALFGLFRGDENPGVRGMPRERQIGPAILFRPLLDQTRQNIEAEARRLSLDWIDDTSNDDLSIDRNFIRHELLPLVLSRFPRAGRSILAAIARDDAFRDLVKEVAAGDCAGALGEFGGIGTGSLASLSPARQMQVIRQVVAETGSPQPASAALRQFLGTLSPRSRLAWGERCLRVHRGEIHLLHEPVQTGFAERSVARTGPLQLAGGLFTAAREPGSGLWRGRGRLTVRPAGKGDAIELQRRKTVRQLCQEQGIPAWLRDHLPVLCLDGTPVAIPAIPAWGVPGAIAAAHGAGPARQGWVFRYEPSDRVPSMR